MQKIQKFHFGNIYSTSKSTKTYELIERNGHYLTFKVRNPKTRDSWKQCSTSTFKADETRAFEEIIFNDGIRLRADSYRQDHNNGLNATSEQEKGKNYELENLTASYIHVEGYADLRSIYYIMCQEYPSEFDRKSALQAIRKVLREELYS